MKLYHKKSGTEAFSSKFNINSVSEIIVYSRDGDCISDYISNYDVLIGEEWVDLHKAFIDKDVMSDDSNTYFMEPPTPADRERGYIL